MAQFKKGNILDHLADFDILVFTSNGVVTRTNKLVMGAGVAKAFKDAFPNLDYELGLLVKEKGVYDDKKDAYANRAHYLYNFLLLNYKNIQIGALQTKLHFQNFSTLDLVKTSLHKMVEVCGTEKKVALPMPGVGLGNLKWESVKALVETLPDNYTVFSLEVV